MTLQSVLDKLWTASPPRHDTASKLLPSLSEEEIRDVCQKLLVASSDGALICEPISHNVIRITVKGTGKSSNAYVRRTLVPHSLIHFTDAAVSLVADGAFRELWGDTRQYRMADLLVAMQWARDHADSLLFHPSNLRSAEFDAVAKELDIPVELLKRLITSATPSNR